MNIDFHSFPWKDGQGNVVDTWWVRQRYHSFQQIGQGGYGGVAMLKDAQNNDEKVAIKKLDKPFDQPQPALAPIYAQRAYRELRILKFMKENLHQNVISLIDAFEPPAPPVSDGAGAPCQDHPHPTELYFVTPHMDMDLFRLIQTGALNNQDSREHIQAMTYQV